MSFLWARRAATGALTLWVFSCSGGGAQAPIDPTTWFAEWASLAQSAEEQGTIVVEGREGWLFFGPELRHLGVGKFWGEEAAAVSKARRPEWADPLLAILDFHNQLREAGVDLVVVPVPPKAIVYPDKAPSTIELSGDPPPRLDVQHQSFYALLRENGIDVLDLTELFLSNRHHPEGHMYCQQDTHWSGVATYLRMQATPTIALTPRFEFYSDPMGFTTGTRQFMKEFTLTPEFTISENLVTRFEWRADWSTEPTFTVGDPSDDPSVQNTLGVGLILKF